MAQVLDVSITTLGLLIKDLTISGFVTALKGQKIYTLNIARLNPEHNRSEDEYILVD
ncbi:hypothetical protein [Sansalvadorimonas verongulae]|uniref:hypothetical protein n=1 Tax=Sansalvadorimonas verongulae TaxID=2172824 RepID=UPI0018AD10FA|nr:hypothetical protein [Sansalvadorimonas verongulae]